MLEAFRELAAAKQLVKELRSRGSLGDDLSQPLSRLSDLADRILVRVQDYAKGPVAPIIVRELALFREGLSYPPANVEVRQPWLEEQGRVLDRVQTNLVSLYDLAPLSMGTIS